MIHELSQQDQLLGAGGLVGQEFAKELDTVVLVDGVSRGLAYSVIALRLDACHVIGKAAIQFKESRTCQPFG